MKSMEINSNQIFIGNVKLCTHYKLISRFRLKNFQYIPSTSILVLARSKLYKENVILIKIKNGRYVDLEEYKSFLDDRRILKDTYCLGKLVLPKSPYCIESLFVDETSLQPYYKKDHEIETLSIRELKKKVKTKTLEWRKEKSI